ncbi:Tfb4-domain-containing protein [Fistulina hepatica ATCC 64428]|uniref:General transcription and DNA repair factor IIH subunit TFB4 n=1 Tax=Fistulina hepatica ATCC 64428 TaxID=1128425 RepID=A0A0D7A0A6_9AGAR|nr:Tfb4-domain-containing protein [Fistulina hepatica ATCC 64428]
MDDGQGSHLSVVVDLSPAEWHRLARQESNPLSLATFLSHLLAFLNAHLISKYENTLAVFGAFPWKRQTISIHRTTLLYSSTERTTDSYPSDANAYLPFKVLDSSIVDGILDEFDALETADDAAQAPTALVGALLKAVCYVNRVTRTPPDVSTSVARPNSTKSAPIAPIEPRILIISVSEDLATSYIPIMNAIFSAQKLKAIIDVCQIFGADSAFLQQAAHLTGGSYILLDRRDALLQYLMMAFLPPPSLRKVMAVPAEDKVEFRAACFCHKNVTDIGFVCSVCLSIFCRPVPVCSTCRTKFPIKTLQRLAASLPWGMSSRSGTPVSTTPSRAPSASLATPVPSVPSTPSANRTMSSSRPAHTNGGLPSSANIRAHER